MTPTSLLEAISPCYNYGSFSALCESKKCLPKGRQRAIHLLLKVSRIEEMSEAPRAGGPVRVGLCRINDKLKIFLLFLDHLWTS